MLKDQLEHKDIRVSIKKINILGLLLFHLFFASTTFVDKLTFLDDIKTEVVNFRTVQVPIYDLGLDYSNGSTNTFFLGTITFWLNFFLLSLSPFLLCIYVFRDWKIIATTFSLPLYFGFILFRSIENAETVEDLILPNLSYFIYSLLFLSLGILTLKAFSLNKQANDEAKIEDLEDKLLRLNLDGKNISHKSYFKALNYAIKGASMEDMSERNKYIEKALNEVNVLLKELD